tara:strand:- start:1002 stop:1628 length:627 start_codon:yes stop_codon:yes gene_type:complete
MAFVFTVDDGTGLSNSNSYVSVSDADDYHTGRGNTLWTHTSVTTEEKEDALVRATDYIDKRFARKFRGWKSSSSQSLQWPRTDAEDDSGYLLQNIPTQLQQAVAEYAMRSISLHELSPDPISPVPAQKNLNGHTRDLSATGEVSSKTEKIGPIEETTEYRDVETSVTAAGLNTKSSLVSDYNIPEYPAADMLLEELLDSAASRRVVRG